MMVSGGSGVVRAAVLQAGGGSGLGPFPGAVYTVPVVLTVVGGAVLLFAVDPEVTDWTVVGLAPWVASGAALHVLYQQPAFFPNVRPLFGSPLIYLTTIGITLVAWTASSVVVEMRPPDASCARQLGAVGTGVFISLVGYSIYIAAAISFIRPLWPVLGFALAVMGAAFAWIALSLTFTDVAAVTGRSGALVVFGHTLDGVSTALGIDVLGVEERTPLARGLLDFSAGLPTADVIGVGWLFLLAKLLIALMVVIAFKEYVEYRPTQARLILVLVAALGLGPGIHNLLLFTVIETVGIV
ncbi:DUF63 domain-containing protein [Halobacteriales archaeon QS_8_69_26]|nr:MAG: DUF63 domain-containing protein [Halobacteriales archaeon QS_8_69_26]